MQLSTSCWIALTLCSAICWPGFPSVEQVGRPLAFSIGTVHGFTCLLLTASAPLSGALTIDTVIMNPPFGTRVKNADMIFLKAAFDVASSSVYSLHKTSTREVRECSAFAASSLMYTILSPCMWLPPCDQHIIRTAASWGAHCEVLAEMKFDVPQMHKFHKHKSVDIDVDFIRLSKPS
jgi:predicted RNA methylase